MNLQLVGELPTCQRGDAVAHRAVAFLDDEAGGARVIGVVAHQRRRYDQVFLRRQLALQFLGQAHKGTSALHVDLQTGNAGTASPTCGNAHPRQG